MLVFDRRDEEAYKLLVLGVASEAYKNYREQCMSGVPEIKELKKLAENCWNEEQLSLNKQMTKLHPDYRCYFTLIEYGITFRSTVMEGFLQERRLDIRGIMQVGILRRYHLGKVPHEELLEVIDEHIASVKALWPHRAKIEQAAQSELLLHIASATDQELLDWCRGRRQFIPD